MNILFSSFHINYLVHYLDLAIDLKDMYSLDRAIFVPIVISANGLIDQYLPDALDQLGIKGKHSVLEKAQKVVILATCATVRRILANDRNPHSTRKLNVNTIATQRRSIENNNKISIQDQEDILRRKKTALNPNGEDQKDENYEEKIATNRGPNKNRSHYIENIVEVAQKEIDQGLSLDRIRGNILGDLREKDKNMKISRPPLKKVNNNAEAREVINIANGAMNEIIEKYLEKIYKYIKFE
ncbi:hypothetical protein HHI36_002625 [Cryptolaemus montrouzieri]|uniref:Uncharacterized protein n=1 Tax=Cryptolaemus montrouzieri TaxID=559131 RepID=A0ABD2PBI7_9CUCU